MVTIAKGDHSGFGFNNPDFSGADLIIRDPDAWRAFWAAHTEQPDPPPPVDFQRQAVIAVIQGRQSSGGGPNIAITDVRRAGPLTEIVVVDDERPGPPDIITNPFHIVSTCREMLPPGSSVVFQHLRPLPQSGTVIGRVFARRLEGDPVPLPGAHVVLAGQNSDPRHAMTGMDGSYFFVNVQPGQYKLRAEHPAFEPAEAAIHVPPDTLVAHDFFLTPLPPPPPGMVEGLVLGERPGDEPVPLNHALVQLFRGNLEVARRWTNEQGTFWFEEVPPGSYRLVASHQGFAPQEFLFELGSGEALHHVFILRPVPPGPPQEATAQSPNESSDAVLKLPATGQQAR
jgi:hypothetical protein